MSIGELFTDRDEQDHLLDQVIHDMEVFGDTSAEGENGMGQLFAAALLVDVSAALLLSVYMTFPHG